MPIPDFQSLMLPALNALSGGRQAPVSEVRERIAIAEGLAPDDMQEMLPSGRQSVFANRVSWAVKYLERAGLKAICAASPVRSTRRVRPRACSSPPPISRLLQGTM